MSQSGTLNSQVAYMFVSCSFKIWSWILKFWSAVLNPRCSDVIPRLDTTDLLLNLACWRWCRLFQCKHHAKLLSQGLLSSLESVHSHSSLKEHSTVQYLGENSVLLNFPRDRSLKMMASWELAGKPQLPQINLYLKSTMAINTTESQFLKLWYSLHGATPPGGHLIGMWQPSIAVQQKGNCHMSFISFIWSLSPAR